MVFALQVTIIFGNKALIFDKNHLNCSVFIIFKFILLMKKVNFRDWTMDAIDEAFGTSETDSCPFLDKLLAFKYEISDYEKMYTTELLKI
jgi:hypothetical protein